MSESVRLNKAWTYDPEDGYTVEHTVNKDGIVSIYYNTNLQLLIINYENNSNRYYTAYTIVSMFGK